MDAIFTWLHLSDIHAGHGSLTHRLDQHLTVEQLLDDLREPPEGAPAPRAIFVTGDLAFSGAVRNADGQDEYETVGGWIRRVAMNFDLPLRDVYVVPGNHDVQRSVIEGNSDLALRLEALRAGEHTIDDSLADQRDLYDLRFANFTAFSQGLAPVHPSVAAGGFAWCDRLTADGGLGVRLVGLNTALLCHDDKDHGRLRLGKRQLTHTLFAPQRPRDEMVIVLAHHPLDWLADGAEVRALLRRRAHLYLHGHIHEAASRQVSTGGGEEMVTVAAGAVHGDESEDTAYGYTYGAVYGAPGRALEVRLWPRAWSKTNQRFQIDADNVPSRGGPARHGLALVLPEPAVHNRPKAVPSALFNLSSQPLIAAAPYTAPLVVYVVWHPRFGEGEKLAEAVYSRLSHDVHAPLSRGLGIPVFFRCEAYGNDGTPRPIDVGAAHQSAIVALIDDELLADAAWRSYLLDLLGVCRAAPRHRFFAAALTGNALNLPGVSDDLVIPLDRCDGVERYDELRLRLTHGLFRQLHLGDDDPPPPIRVFVSHAKADGVTLAREIREHLMEETRIKVFLDEKDLAIGWSLDAGLDQSLRRQESLLLAVRTDAYASRPCCRRELLRAKELMRPIVVVEALSRGEPRSFPYLGNVPTLNWAPGNREFWYRLIDTVMFEALRFRYLPRYLKQVVGMYTPEHTVLTLARPPEILSLRAADGREQLVLYPDPPLGAEELEIYEHLTHDYVLTTPATLVSRIRSLAP